MALPLFFVITVISNNKMSISTHECLSQKKQAFPSPQGEAPGSLLEGSMGQKKQKLESRNITAEGFEATGQVQSLATLWAVLCTRCQDSLQFPHFLILL